jgi:hypothetical protein
MTESSIKSFDFFPLTSSSDLWGGIKVAGKESKCTRGQLVKEDRVIPQKEGKEKIASSPSETPKYQ